MYFHRTVRDCTATVWRRCSVAVDVVVDRWRCRPDVERRSAFFYNLGKKFVKRTVR